MVGKTRQQSPNDPQHDPPPSLDELLRARRDLEYQLSGVGARRRVFNESVVRSIDGASSWMRKHWLAVVNVVLATWIGVAVLTPVAYAAGLAVPASSIFHVYRFACDQIPSHSFYVFGYQMCLCSRCLSIYSSMLVFGLTLGFVRNRFRLPPMTWWMWFVTMLPMALDGGTQFFGWRESTNLLRVITGVIFGLGTAWFTLVQLEQTAHDFEQPAVQRA